MKTATIHRLLPLDPMPPIDVALEVAQTGIADIKSAGGNAVIGGGTAMCLYGYASATRDVDLYATTLPRKRPAHRISFGGGAYTMQHAWGRVSLFVIVRADQEAELYADAIVHPRRVNGLRVVSPEHLAIISMFALRPKDVDHFRHLVTVNLLSERRIDVVLHRVFGDGVAVHLMR